MKKIIPKILAYILVLGLLSGFVLTACQPKTGTTDLGEAHQDGETVTGELESETVNEMAAYSEESAAPEPEVQTETKTGEAENLMAAPAETPTESPPPVAAEPQEAAPVAEVAPPPHRGADLVSTNPSTVSLASGKLQLIELFAYW